MGKVVETFLEAEGQKITNLSGSELFESRCYKIILLLLHMYVDFYIAVVGTFGQGGPI